MAKAKNPTNMTANWVKTLVLPKSERVDYFDADVKGMGLRVSPTGNKSWFVFYRNQADRKARRLVLGTYPALTLGPARDLAREKLLEAQKGADPAAKRQVEKDAPTFQELALDYIERDAKHNIKSWRVSERNLAKYVYPKLGAMKAHEIKKADVIDLLEVVRNNNGPIISNRVLSLIRRVYSWAIEREMLASNPARVKPLAPEKQREKVLTPDEIRAVWRACDEQDAAVAAMFKLRLLTAQRGQEVESMAWADLDLTTGWWTVPAKDVKNKRTHRVPLAPAARELILAMKSRSGSSPYVFPSPVTSDRHIVNVQKAAKRVQVASGVTDLTMHDLRRTAASHMTGMKIPRLVVSKILNHVERGVTAVYDRHSYDDDKREALEAWAKRLGEMLAEVGPLPLAPPLVPQRPVRRRRTPANSPASA